MYMSINPRHILAGLVIMASQLLSAQTLSDGQTLVKNAMLTPQDEQMVLTMDVCLDELKLKRNQSVVMHPVLYSLDRTQKATFEPLVIDSRTEYVLYKRGVSNKAYRDVSHVKRNKGKAQTEYYHSSVPYQSWMERSQLHLEEFELRSFEDNMTIYSVEFSSGTTTDYVTGMCYYDLNKLSSGSHFLPNNLISYESGNTSIKFDFGESGKAVSESQNIYLTFFTLPRAYTNPVIKVDCKVNGMRSTKKLVLKKTDSDLTFPAGSFAQINGVEVKGDFLCFKTITVNGTVVAWDTVDDQNPAILPQASQFNVKGTGVLNVYDEHKGEGDPTSPDYDPDYGKPYRQYWVVPEGKTATVSFKIVTPREGTYTITPVGDTDGFTVGGTLSGAIPADGKISFTVTSTTDAEKTLHFKTSITSGGVTYNIDSETQLFDIRGYHYFVTVDPLPHLNP